MTKRKITVKIENSKVVFSKEILEYFKSLRNEETNEWVDKYIEVLSDTSNFDAEKYNVHHIKPCFTFKDKEHKNRKETEPLANKFNENTIKLSIYNHILAHYYLWRIYDNQDSKFPLLNLACIDRGVVFSEDEIKTIAKIVEICKKNNLTEEELKEHDKIYRENHKEDTRKRARKRYNLLCQDALDDKLYRYGRFKDIINTDELHKNLIASDYIITENLEFYEKEFEKQNSPKYKDKNDWRKKNQSKINEKTHKRDSQMCKDIRYPNEYIMCTKRALIYYLKKNNIDTKNMNYTEFANQFILTDEEIKHYHLKEKKSSKRISKNNSKRSKIICKDPRYKTVIKFSHGQYEKLTTWGNLRAWARRNSNHYLLNGMSPVEFTNSYILKENEIVKEPSLEQIEKFDKLLKEHLQNMENFSKISVKKSKNKNKERSKSICKDPRFGISMNGYLHNNEYTTFSSLRNWARNHPNHPLVNNMSPSKWATQFILTQQELEEYKKTHSIE